MFIPSSVAVTTNVFRSVGNVAYMKTLAERMTWAREELDLSQAAVAKAAGVSQSTIGNLEAGIRKKPRELLPLALALNVTPEWLSTGKGQPRGGLSPRALRIASLLDTLKHDEATFDRAYGLLRDVLDRFVGGPSAPESKQPLQPATPAPDRGKQKHGA